MTCQAARERFSPLVDGVIGPAERAELEAHLAGCPECRRELEGFRRTVALLRQAAPVRAPAGFVDRVLAAARPAPWWRRLSRRLFVPLPVKLPLEAAAIALIAVSAVYLTRQPPEVHKTARQEAPVASAPMAPAASATPAPGRPGARALAETAPAAGAPAPPAALRKDAQKAAARDVGGLYAVQPAPAVRGRLAVADREATARALADLIAGLGGSGVTRQVEAEDVIVGFVVPRAAYPALVSGLERLGTWRLDEEATPLLPEVRVEVRITR